MVELQWGQIKPAPPGTAWRLKLLDKLPPEQNRGKHHAYITAVQNGRDVRGNSLAVRWGWEGMDAPPQVAFLDKPAGEPATNIPIMKGMRIWLEVSDLQGIPSDRISGLHTDYPDEAMPSDGLGGNTRFHHSFNIVFEIDVQSNTPPGDVLAGLVDVKAQLRQALNQVDNLIQMVGGL